MGSGTGKLVTFGILIVVALAIAGLITGAIGAGLTQSEEDKDSGLTAEGPFIPKPAVPLPAQVKELRRLEEEGVFGHQVFGSQASTYSHYVEQHREAFPGEAPPAPSRTGSTPARPRRRRTCRPRPTRRRT